MTKQTKMLCIIILIKKKFNYINNLVVNKYLI